MNRTNSSHNGVPALIITFPQRRGLVVVMNIERTDYPTLLEAGIHISVFPFGVGCGVAVTHSIHSRNSAVKAYDQVAPAAGAAATNDEALVDQLASALLAKAELSCADFDPELSDETLAGAGTLDSDRDMRLTAARDHNREVGEKLYLRVLANQEKQQRKRDAKATRIRLEKEIRRQRREGRLVKQIARFKSMGGNLRYRHMLWLQVRGDDVYASLDAESIGRRSAHESIIEVRRWLTEVNDRAEALRWILRGLSVNLAIRKVIADSQERELRGTFPLSVPAGQAATLAYSYKRVS